MAEAPTRASRSKRGCRRWQAAETRKGGGMACTCTSPLAKTGTITQLPPLEASREVGRFTISHLCGMTWALIAISFQSSALRLYYFNSVSLCGMYLLYSRSSPPDRHVQFTGGVPFEMERASTLSQVHQPRAPLLTNETSPSLLYIRLMHDTVA